MLTSFIPDSSYVVSSPQGTNSILTRTHQRYPLSIIPWQLNIFISNIQRKLFCTLIVMLVMLTNSTLANQHSIDSLQNKLKKLAHDTTLLNATSVAQQCTSKVLLATTLSNIGNAYMQQGNYKQALTYELQAVKLSQRINDKKQLATALVAVGNIYNQLDYFQKSINYYNYSIAYFRATNNVSGILSTQANIANVYARQGKFDSSLAINTNALPLAQQLNDTIILAAFWSNAALDYGSLSEQTTNKTTKALYYEKSISYTLTALQLRKSINDKEGIANSLYNLAELYSIKKDYANGKRYLLQALPACKANGNILLLKHCYQLLSGLYEEQHNYTQALRYHKLAVELKDSIFNLASSKQIAEMNAKYETEKKQYSIDLLTTEKQINQGQLKQHQTNNYFLIISIVVLLVIGVRASMGYQQKIKTNALIAAQHEAISIQEAAITAQITERNRIAQDLHDGVGGTLAGIKLNLINLNNGTQLNPIISTLYELCAEIRTMSHDLASARLSTTKAFTQVLQETVQPFNGETAINVALHCFPISVINQLPTLVQEAVHKLVQELLKNAYLHAKASSIEINLSVQDANVYLLVEDNGIGFNTTAAHKGLGLKNINARVQALNGTLHIDSQPAQGTTISITLLIPTV